MRPHQVAEPQLFREGDIVECLVDIDKDLVRYCKNGKLLNVQLSNQCL